MSYKSILKKGRDEFEEKKSRFIGYSAPVQTEEEALEFIEEISKKHYDATHNCTAYIIGEDMLTQRFNDDGEPSGTAGLPMLEYLKINEITDTVLVVTRYFGGTKLGAGGLIRAYAKGARIAVEAGTVVDMKEYKLIKIVYDYTYHGAIENYLQNKNFYIEEQIFTDDVEVHILVKSEDVEPIHVALLDMTSGEIEYSEIDSKIMPEKDGELIIE